MVREAETTKDTKFTKEKSGPYASRAVIRQALEMPHRYSECKVESLLLVPLVRLVVILL